MLEPTVIRRRARALLAGERAILKTRLRRSRDYESAAAQRLPGAVASDFQRGAGPPIVMAGGRGSRVWDLDGSNYVDMHVASGAALAGHGNTQIAGAVRQVVRGATCFAAASPDALPVLAELTRRFEFELWRPVNSGTEATMAAVRIARSLTGRDRILKVAGGYNGHHDAVLVDVERDGGEPGVPLATAALTTAIPYGDISSLHDALRERDVACVVTELPLLTPILSDVSSGYITALRQLCEEYGALLVVDEVKTGIAVHEFGARGVVGQRGHLVAIGKSFAGGLPCGAVGGETAVMEAVGRGRPPVYGTFNGNPLSMAAARTMLTEVMVAGTHDRLDRLARRLVSGASTIAHESGLPLTPASYGGKGSLISSRSELARNPRADLVELVWTYCLNRGVFLAPAPDVRWTVSAAHSDADIDGVIDVLRQLGAEWLTLSERSDPGLEP